MVSVSKVSANYQTPKAFQAKKENKDVTTNIPQQQVIIVRQTGGVAPAVLSCVCPGLGQLLDGRPGAAAGAFFGVTGVGIAALMGFAAVSAKFKSGAASLASGIIGALAFAGAYVGNIVNAARGKKTQINFDA